MRAAILSKLRDDAMFSVECDAAGHSEPSVIFRWLPWVFWLGVGIAIVVLSRIDKFAWDAVELEKFYPHRFAYFQGDPIAAFPYPPLVTIPGLWVANALPSWAMWALLGMVYVAGFAAMIWAGMQLVSDQERGIFRLVAPIITFFPGLLMSEAVFCGN